MSKHHPIKLYVWLMRTDPVAAAKLAEEHKDDEVFCAAVQFHDMLLDAMCQGKKKLQLPFVEHPLFPAIEAPPKGSTS